MTLNIIFFLSKMYICHKSVELEKKLNISHFGSVFAVFYWKHAKATTVYLRMTQI